MSITINGTTGVSGVDGTASAPSVQGGDSNTGVFFPAADTVAVTTGGAERMRIDTSGNVGIGTVSPGALLDINGSAFVRGSGAEGGEIAFFNPDRTITGMTVDVSSANVGRIFQTQNNSLLQLGQLVGTGGTVSLYTAATERMHIDASGNLKFNSGYGSAATAYGCRAWVKFGGVGTISGSGNVTSVTNPSTGRYVVSFTTAMPDANYAVSTGGTVVDSTGNPWQAWGNISRGYGTGSFTIDCSAQGTTGAGQANWAIVTVAVFR